MLCLTSASLPPRFTKFLLSSYPLVNLTNIWGGREGNLQWTIIRPSRGNINCNASRWQFMLRKLKIKALCPTRWGLVWNYFKLTILRHSFLNNSKVAQTNLFFSHIQSKIPEVLLSKTIANQLVLKIITNLYIIPRLLAWNRNTLKRKENLNVWWKSGCRLRENRQKLQCVQQGKGRRQKRTDIYDSKENYKLR